MVYTFYNVKLPYDLFSELPDARVQLEQHAIYTARERARDYRVPALWSARLLTTPGYDASIRVLRVSR